MFLHHNNLNQNILDKSHRSTPVLVLQTLMCLPTNCNHPNHPPLLHLQPFSIWTKINHFHIASLCYTIIDLLYKCSWDIGPSLSALPMSCRNCHDLLSGAIQVSPKIRRIRLPMLPVIGQGVFTMIVWRLEGAGNRLKGLYY